MRAEPIHRAARAALPYSTPPAAPPDRDARHPVSERRANRLLLVAAGLGLALSLALHVAVVAGIAFAPAAPWSWALHAGSIAGFWVATGRVAAAGLRGVAGLLRVRRMVPVPIRLALAAASLNAIVTAWLGLTAPALAGRALTAYWTLMYLLIATLFAFVVRPLGAPVIE
jgi:hypothetical protein